MNIFEIKNTTNISSEEAEIRRQIANLASKKTNYKKAGKDITNIEQELQRLKNELNKFKKSVKTTNTIDNKADDDYKRGYNDAIKEIQRQISQQQQQSQQSQLSNRNGGKDENGNSIGNATAVDCQNSLGKNETQITGTIISKADGDNIKKAEGMSSSNTNASASNIKQRNKQLADEARKIAQKQQGTNSGAWSEIISKISNLYDVAINWRKELKKIVGVCINPIDSRQAYAHKNILVTQNRIARTSKDQYDSLNYIIALMDVSGSMSEKQQMMCLKEIYQTAIQKMPLKIYIIYFDTQVLKVDEFKSINELEKYMKAPKYIYGGGTTLKPIFNYLRTQKPFMGKKAELVIVFTDGYIDEQKRDIKTMKWLVWAIIDNPTWKPKQVDSHTKCIHLRLSDIQ